MSDQPAPPTDSAPDIAISVYGKTDVGLIREHNEDNFLIADVSAGTRTNDPKETVAVQLGNKGVLFLVCDGMGGAAAGEVASQMAVDSIAGSLAAAEPLGRDPFARRLRRAIEDANDKIYAQSRDNQSERGMGTTCTAAALVDGTLVIGQIGDSRCYVMRAGRLSQVTKDQSLAWQLIEAGAMTAEEAKAFEHANIILQALGVQERVEVVLSQVDLRRGDIVVLSSDGLHGPVSDEEISQILTDEPDIKRACDRLISRALERDGPDNVTVVLARVDGPSLAEPSETDTVGFTPYDPGVDPSDTRRSQRHEAVEKVTVEVTIPKDVIRMTSGQGQGGDGAGGTLGSPASATSQTGTEPRSVLTFVFLAMLAAAAGIIFIKWDRDRTVEGQTGQTTATPMAPAAAEPAAPAAPPAGPTPAP